MLRALLAGAAVVAGVVSVVLAMLLPYDVCGAVAPCGALDVGLADSAALATATVVAGVCALVFASAALVAGRAHRAS